MVKLSLKDIKSICEGTTLALHINEREQKRFIVKRILRTMHLGGHYVLSLLVEREEDSQELELIVAEEMKTVSIVTVK